MTTLSSIIRSGTATILRLTNRSGTVVEIPLTNGFLQITNRATSVVNVPVT